MRLPVILIAVPLLLWAGSRVAAGNPSEDLDSAREKFSGGDYGSTVALVAPLLYPTLTLSDPDEITEAHLMLGVAYFELGKHDSADRELELALLSDPELSLDPVLYDDEVVKAFNQKKAAMKERLEELAEQRLIAEENERLRQQLANQTTVTVEKRAYYVNYIPFGAGQFQNGQRGKGVFFAISEAALGGSSLALFSAQILKYGFNGKVPQDDIPAVNRMQVIQVGTGAMFIAVAAWGVIDALANYQPQTTTTRGGPPVDTGKKAAFWIAPGGGPGLVLTWEF